MKDFLTAYLAIGLAVQTVYIYLTCDRQVPNNWNVGVMMVVMHSWEICLWPLYLLGSILRFFNRRREDG